MAMKKQQIDTKERERERWREKERRLFQKRKKRKYNIVDGRFFKGTSRLR